ncbi:hypothetical protein GCM10007389_02940 [Pontibacter akesuensis]|nr:hypothetical protein GCM10007389_02940 [Pontibacter akesuensis]
MYECSPSKGYKLSSATAKQQLWQTPNPIISNSQAVTIQEEAPFNTRYCLQRVKGVKKAPTAAGATASATFILE